MKVFRGFCRCFDENIDVRAPIMNKDKDGKKKKEKEEV